MYINLTLIYYVVQVEFLKIYYLEKTYFSLLCNEIVLEALIFGGVNRVVTLINQALFDV